MNTALLIAILNLVAKVGLDAAIHILDGIKNAKTPDQAIDALRASRAITWEDFQKAADATPPPV